MYERFLKRNTQSQKQDNLAKQRRNVEQDRLAQETKVQSLLDAVNDSTRHVRNYYISFFLFGLYLFQNMQPGSGAGSAKGSGSNLQFWMNIFPSRQA